MATNGDDQGFDRPYPGMAGVAAFIQAWNRLNQPSDPLSKLGSSLTSRIPAEPRMPIIPLEPFFGAGNAPQVGLQDIARFLLPQTSLESLLAMTPIPLGTKAGKTIKEGVETAAEAAGRLTAADLVLGKHSIPVQRIHSETGSLSSLAKDKPQGLYVSMKDRWTASTENPHLDLLEEAGARIDTAIANTKKPLEVKGGLWLEHPRFRGAGGSGRGPVSAGVAAFHQLAGPAEYDRIRRLTIRELRDELAEKFPGYDYSKFQDHYGLVEAYGARLANKQNYDVIISRDPTFPGFDEMVVLDPSVLKE